MKVIVTGATGMVGEGVLHECLLSNEVEQVLVINRKPCGVVHPKLKEIIHSDFFDMSSIENQLVNYDGCFYCLGTTSLKLTEEQYSKVSYTLTIYIAEILVKLNPNITFCYVSGAGTDGTEKGKFMWARVKGRTENQLMKLGFKKVFLFRPGLMKPTKGLKNTIKAYKYVTWLFPLLTWLLPKFVCTLKEVGSAMINTISKGYSKSVLEVKDIVDLAKK